jgi:hypothetical protein
MLIKVCLAAAFAILLCAPAIPADSGDTSPLKTAICWEVKKGRVVATCAISNHGQSLIAVEDPPELSWSIEEPGALTFGGGSSEKSRGRNTYRLLKPTPVELLEKGRLLDDSGFAFPFSVQPSKEFRERADVRFSAAMLHVEVAVTILFVDPISHEMATKTVMCSRKMNVAEIWGKKYLLEFANNGAEPDGRSRNGDAASPTPKN